MQKIIFLTLASLCLFTPVTHAAGLFVTNGITQVAPAADRAIIVFDGKTETIYTSQTFTVNPQIVWNFAYVIAVPSKPTVKPLTVDLMSEIEKISTPYDNPPPLLRALFSDHNFQAYPRKNLFTRPTDWVRWDVFGPEEITRMNTWFTNIGYILPKLSAPKIDEYRKRGWYFVVAEVNGTHVQMDAVDSLTIHGAHTLPLVITFDTEELVYPAALASIQPDTDSTAVPHGFSYALKSQDILGEQDSRIDQELSTQSANKYPSLPLDYSTLTQELFVISDRPYEHEQFIPVFIQKIATSTLPTDDKGDPMIAGPTKFVYLSRLLSYTPLIQTSDITLTPARTTKSLNVKPTSIDIIIRIIMIAGIVTLFVLWIKKQKTRG